MHEKDKTPQRLFGCAEHTAPRSEFNFTDEDYTLVWESLLGAIGESNYFSGKIHTDHEGFCSVLTISVIIYRDREQPECPVCDIVPIWWQMATYSNFDGEGELCKECPNDFEFCDLRRVCKGN